jgi:hypothetical protein
MLYRISNSDDGTKEYPVLEPSIYLSLLWFQISSLACPLFQSIVQQILPLVEISPIVLKALPTARSSGFGVHICKTRGQRGDGGEAR